MQVMKRVFICGPFSSDSLIGVFDNMKQGIRAATEVLLAGYAPFCAWTDYHLHLMLNDNEQLNIQNYYEYTKAWLKVSDAVFALTSAYTSKGASEELELAEKLNIPIIYNIQELDELFTER